jgi:PilZ domain-containing protein
VQLGSTPERRKSRRFLFELDLHYRILSRQSGILMGVGKTLNISSSGVLFASDYGLPIDTRVEVSIRWPVGLNENCGLNLVGSGPVVRNTKGQLALRFRQWEFRTRAQKFTDN